MEQHEFNEAFSRALKHALTELGVDHRNPLEMQRDFATMREIRELFGSDELRRDLAHLRRWRLAMEEVRSKGTLTAVGLLVTGLAALLLVGLKHWKIW